MELPDATLKSSAPAWVPGSGSVPVQRSTSLQSQSSSTSSLSSAASAPSFVPASQRGQQAQQAQHMQQQHQHQHHQQQQQQQQHQQHLEQQQLEQQASFLEAERLTCRACEPAPPRRTFASTQLAPELRAYFAHSLKLTLDQLPLSDARIKEVPKWFSAVNPLDSPAKTRGAAGSSGYPTSVYKVVNNKDGFLYALRRIDNVRGAQSLQPQCDATLQLWKPVRHANIVPLRQAFVHQRAVFLVHDYWPGAQTLADYVASRGMGNLLPEGVLWSIATQLLSALRAAHAQGVSFRGGLIPQRVLLTGRNRVRLASGGLTHVLDARGDVGVGVGVGASGAGGAGAGMGGMGSGSMGMGSGSGESGPEAEAAGMPGDVRGVAQLLLVLSCMSTQVLQSPEDSLEFVASRYSPELTALVAQPLQRDGVRVGEMLERCSRGLLQEVDELYSHSDALENHLCKQLETARLNRLLLKLNLVNERPEYGKTEAASWAETGDRYLLKLFRDYVFHQTDDQGQPWVDVGHIVTSLNKVDIAAPEKILLVSRDGRSMLVVTFADVRKCLDEAFEELMDGHRSSQYYMHKRANPSGASQGHGQGHGGARARAMQLQQQQELAYGMGHSQMPMQQGHAGNPYSQQAHAQAQGHQSQLYTAATHQGMY